MMGVAPISNIGIASAFTACVVSFLSPYVLPLSVALRAENGRACNE